MKPHSTIVIAIAHSGTQYGPGAFAIGRPDPNVPVVTGTLPECTEPELALTAAVKALDRFHGKHQVTLVTSSTALVDILTIGIPLYLETNWRHVPDNAPVKHAQLYQQVEHLVQRNVVKIVHTPATASDVLAVEVAAKKALDDHRREALERLNKALEEKATAGVEVAG